MAFLASIPHLRSNVPGTLRQRSAGDAMVHSADLPALSKLLTCVRTVLLTFLIGQDTFGLPDKLPSNSPNTTTNPHLSSSESSSTMFLALHPKVVWIVLAWNLAWRSRQSTPKIEGSAIGKHTKASTPHCGLSIMMQILSHTQQRWEMSECQKARTEKSKKPNESIARPERWQSRPLQQLCWSKMPLVTRYHDYLPHAFTRKANTKPQEDRRSSGNAMPRWL